MTNEHLNPSRRELATFSWLWVVFCALIALLAAFRPGSLASAGVFTLVLALAALALDRTTPARRAVIALIIPGFLLGLWLVGRAAGGLGASAGAVSAGVLVGIGVVGTGAMLASRPLARRFHALWMSAAVPIGWSVSMIALAIVFLAVIVPIGLLSRVVGRDPMSRRFEPGRASYWERRDPPPPARRYFRQY